MLIIDTRKNLPYNFWFTYEIKEGKAKKNYQKNEKIHKQEKIINVLF